jgi:hypothetical protein
MKICPWQPSFSMQMDRQTDRHADGRMDMTKLLAAFHSSVNVPKKALDYYIVYTWYYINTHNKYPSGYIGVNIQ